MSVSSSIKNRGLLSIASSPSYNRMLNLLRRTLLTSLLIGLIWLPGLSFGSAFALPNVVTTPVEVALQPVRATSTENARMNALITCLPKQLSQASLKRAWSEMGDDQIERAFNLKSNPKLSEAEIELKSCMSRQGFTN
jgi:hypothetical protein